MQTELLFGLHFWDLLLLIAASSVAVVSLIGLMRVHREEIADRFRREALEEQLRRRREDSQKSGKAQQAA